MNYSDRRPCSAEGCSQLSVGFSRYCAKHLRRNTTHGHTHGRAIRPFELKPHHTLAVHLLSTYRSRADVAAALRWLDKMLTSCSQPDARAELDRLRREGVTADDLFTASLTVWAFHREWPQSLPDDARLTFAIGRNIVKLRTKRQVRSPNTFKLQSAGTSNKALRHIGLLIRECLPLLFNRLIELNEREQDEYAQLRWIIRNGDEIAAAVNPQ
jgi:hypothetical protein